VTEQNRDARGASSGGNAEISNDVMTKNPPARGKNATDDLAQPSVGAVNLAFCA
jgi:hypothetical protein